MIDAAAIERAENVLKVVYGGDLGRQLENLQIERDVIDNLVGHTWQVVERGYRDAVAAMDPRLQAGINTMLVHFLLVGVIAGRHSAREIV